MSTNPMAWDGGVNPKIAENQKAQDCLLPMGEQPSDPVLMLVGSLTLFWCPAFVQEVSTVGPSFPEHRHVP